jgi:predicted ArsR family transcriptional regulator
MVDSAVSAAGMRIVRLLVGSPPKTVAELIDGAGVTRTAVTEQLSELIAGGYVDRDTQRLPGRGRPRHLYSATDRALSLLAADSQRMVMPAVWEAIEDKGGEELLGEVAEHVAGQLASHYLARIDATNPRERLRQFVDLLRDEGMIIEVHQNNGTLRLCKRSCPYSHLLEDRRAICDVDDRLMRQVIGGPLRRVACRHHGDPCCAYELGE